MGIFLLAVLSGCVRMAVGLLLAAELLSLEVLNKRGVLAGVTGAAVIGVGVRLVNAPAIYQVILDVGWLAFCLRRFWRADGRMGLFVAIFYEIALSLWQFLLMAGMGVLCHSPAFLDRQTLNGQAAAWLLNGLLIGAAFYAWRKHTVKELLTLVVLVGFIAAVTLSGQTVLALADDTLMMWIILAMVLLMAVLVFNMNQQYEAERELAQLKAAQTELLERDYTALSQAYTVNAQLFHDFHNHIGALRQLLTRERYTEAIAYLDDLQSPVREMAQAAWTNDAAADYLINSKAAMAAAGDIRFEVQVEFPQHTNVRSADLCAILGNLLDNALEAAEQVALAEERFIRLTIRRINHMLVIKVENSFAVTPVQQNAQLQTTKSGGLHGWGLASARTAAEKYDGMVQTTYTDHIFCAVATLSYQGVAV